MRAEINKLENTFSKILKLLYEYLIKKSFESLGINTFEYHLVTSLISILGASKLFKHFATATFSEEAWFFG